MPNDPTNSPIPSYAQRLADALAANRKEQEDALAYVERLREEEAWLIAKVAGAAPAVAEATASPEAPSEQAESVGSAPAPAGGKEEATSARVVPKPRRAKRGAPARAKAPAKKKNAGKGNTAPKKGGTGKSAEPPLHKLILDILREKPCEPHQVREVFDRIAEVHPERLPSSQQVVRNNLEKLHHEKVIDKTSQGRSKMYTAPAPDTSTAEADQASENAGEKVPAEV